MSPFDRDPTGGTIRFMWYPAFPAVLHADPETALREANRSLEKLRSFEGGRFVNESPMGALYLTLGKIELVREWFKESTEPGAQRHVFLAAIAYVEEDHQVMTEHLEQALKDWDSQRRIRGPVGREPITRRGRRDAFLAATLQLLLARGGVLSETNSIARTDRGSPDSTQDRRNIRSGPLPDSLRRRIEKRSGILRGVNAVRQDNRIEELKILGDALSSVSYSDSGSAATYFMGSEILAEAWREQEDSSSAAEVLRAALEKEAFLFLDQSVLTAPLWLKLRAQLSQLYREMARDQDAQKIEDELRKRLALADADHPILRQLDHTEELALREPAN